MMLECKMLRAAAPTGARRSRQPSARPVTRQALVVRAHGNHPHGQGHGHGHPHGSPHGTATATSTPSEKDRGFVAEMRKVAMKLHTKDQAPKEGEREASKKPVAKWAPSRENYLNFLVESRAVYEALEGAVRDGGHPEYARFADTGLERSAALAQDIAWFEAEYGLKAPALSATGPGAVYAAKIRELAKSDPPAFICHFYNFYFAHTAGGRMIGSQMSKMLLGGRELAFYQWQGDVAVHLDKVRGSINGLAESWTDSQKAHCLQETEASFRDSGKILQVIGGGSEH